MFCSLVCLLVHWLPLLWCKPFCLLVTIPLIGYFIDAVLSLSMSVSVLETDFNLTPMNRLKSRMNTSVPQIINGSPVPEGRYPFMAAILKQGYGQFCGGSVLNDDSVLTAAHCIESSNKFPVSPATTRVYVGHVSLQGTADPKTLFGVHSWTHHPDFGKDQSFSGDIAVIKLSRKIDFGSLNGQVNQTCIPAKVKSTTADWSRCVVMGWGDTDPNNPNSESQQLLQVTVPVLTPNQCRKYERDYNPNEFICAGFEHKGQGDSCYGDSGGPLVCPVKSDQGSDEQWIQFGVVSHGGIPGHGYICAEVPAFYTRVAWYTQWLRSEAEK